ncbi:hypothetical protein Plhal304r1_c004g0016061 [Plasmopara halstedii]
MDMSFLCTMGWRLSLSPSNLWRVRFAQGAVANNGNIQQARIDMNNEVEVGKAVAICFI